MFLINAVRVKNVLSIECMLGGRVANVTFVGFSTLCQAHYVNLHIDNHIINGVADRCA